MTSQSVQIIGGPNRQHAYVDQALNALHVFVRNTSLDPVPINDVTPDPATEGWVFSASVFDPTVEQLASISLLIRSVAHTPVLGSVMSVGVDFRAELFEAPTTTADGSSVPVVQINRNSAKVTDVLVFSQPTVTADGTPLGTVLVPKDNLTVAGGQIIMQPATDYLLRLTNIGVATSAVSLAASIIDAEAA